MKAHILTLFLSLLAICNYGKGIDFETKKEKSTPPRVIRTCCAFGYNTKFICIPFLADNDVIDVAAIGTHQYLGGKKEGNGIVYSSRGGFLDIGHMRDQADWTAFLYALISTSEEDTITLKLGYEGGPKHLYIYKKDVTTDKDRLALAGRITYDLSIWHEIATGYGTSLVPLVPERYSSFSVEDCYSNLLGINLGMGAIVSEKPYQEAMSEIIKIALDTLGAAKEIEETYDAMDRVYDTWWTRSYRFPNLSVLQMRDFEPYTYNKPHLVNMSDDEACCLPIPSQTTDGRDLSDFYRITFKLNKKFPIKELFPDRESRSITNSDFEQMISWISTDLENRVKPPKPTRKNK